MNTDNIDKLLKDLYQDDEREIEIPGGLEAKLDKLIDELDRKENKNSGRRTNRRIWISSIAAAVAIALLFSLSYIHRGDEPEAIAGTMTATTEDPLTAYQETLLALELVSRNFNKGLKQYTKAELELEKTNLILDNTIKKISQ